MYTCKTFEATSLDGGRVPLSRRICLAAFSSEAIGFATRSLLLGKGRSDRC